MKIEIRKFESVANMLHFIKSKSAIADIARVENDLYILKDWHGVNSADEANDLLTHGYKVDNKDKIFVPTIETSGEVKVNKLDIVGHAPHVPNAINGLPLCMRNKRKVMQKNKVIDLYYSCAFDATKSEETFNEKGSRMVQMITEHERKGIRVNLWAVVTADDHWNESKCKRRTMTIVKLKDAKHPLNIGRLYYPLMHPAFLRYHIFKTWNRLEVASKMDKHYPTSHDLVAETLHIDGVKSILI